jgi:hypothetical protein
MPVIEGALRAAGKLLISGLVQKGLGSNAIIASIKEMGLSYRRTTMLADIRVATGLMKLEKAVRNVAPNILFPIYTMVSSQLRRGARYRVYGTLNVLNTKTGEITPRRISFYTDVRQSKAEWAASFLDVYEGEPYEPNQNIFGMEITSVEHQEGWAY